MTLHRAYPSIPHFIELHFIALSKSALLLLLFFFFYKLKVSGNFASNKSTSTCLCLVSASHFGNSHNISDFFFFTIILFVMVICHQ